MYKKGKKKPRTFKNKDGALVDFSRMSQADLIQNPNLTMTNIAESKARMSLEEQSSALIEQINTLNLGTKQRKPVQKHEKSRFQPQRKAIKEKCLNEVQMFNEQMKASPCCKPGDQKKTNLMGRETCPPLGGMVASNNF